MCPQVKKVSFKAGQTVDEGDILVELEWNHGNQHCWSDF